jgi:hypothetical protein
MAFNSAVSLRSPLALSGRRSVLARNRSTSAFTSVIPIFIDEYISIRVGHRTSIHATRSSIYLSGALTFPHSETLRGTKPHLDSIQKAVRVNERLSGRVRVLLRPEGRAFSRSQTPGRNAVLKTSLWKNAVVEHKAQTHFEGFALLSGLFCCGYPAARVYL